jgi:ABC-type multidrug transport system fused ATPase/permease subunit
MQSKPASTPLAPLPTWLKAWQILTPSQRRAAIGLFVLMLVGMLLETVGLGLVLPALGLMANDDPGTISPAVAAWLQWLGNPPREWLVAGALAVLLAVSGIKAAFMLFLYWQQSGFTASIKSTVADRLFSTYLAQPWTFHLQRNSAQLCRNVTNEVGLFGNAVYMLLSCCVDVLLLTGIAAVLIAVQPVGAFIVAAVLGSSTLLFQRLTKERIARWGAIRQEHDGKKMQHALQGLNGVKDVKVLGREAEFIGAFSRHNIMVADVERRQAITNNLPRLWYELVAVVGLCLLAFTMLLLRTPQTVFIPTIGLFAVAAFRVLPSINRLVLNLQGIRYAAPAVDVVAAELDLIAAEPQPHQEARIVFGRQLAFDGVSYRYPQTTRDALHRVSLQIPRGSAIGFIGESGAGKSTLIDLVLGLLEPTEGRIALDGVDIQTDLRGWQNQIGYVPQAIYLSDDTLRRNVAFGLRDDKIDEAALERALRAAQLMPFIESLPDGLNTFVGERGIRLSGGQRQRIGIARALYHDPAVLVLDEATSALDNETEQAFMECVNSLHGMKTLLLVAHRLTTVAQCDLVYRLRDGRIIDSGTFAEVTKSVPLAAIRPAS